MHQNEKRTCREYRAFVFAHWSNFFVVFSQTLSSSLRKLPGCSSRQLTFVSSALIETSLPYEKRDFLVASFTG